MQRKPGPPADDDVIARGSQPEQLETLRRSQLLWAACHEHDRQREVARSALANQLRRFAHDHARELHVLAARLVGRQDALSVAQEAIANLARRIWMRPSPETMALVKAPKQLWRLSCKIMACRAYDHLRRRRRDPAIEVDRLEHAHEALPPAERVVYILHHYYGFTASDFEKMFGLSKANSHVLVHRAQCALKRAMGVKQ